MDPSLHRLVNLKKYSKNPEKGVQFCDNMALK